MHELTIVEHVVRTITRIAKEQNLTAIGSITLQIGEISGVVPRFVENCYHAVIGGTMLQHTRLCIELLPANGICSSCNKVFHLPGSGNICPYCGCSENKIVSGKEFIIKDISAY